MYLVFVLRVTIQRYTSMSFAKNGVELKRMRDINTPKGLQFAY